MMDKPADPAKKQSTWHSSRQLVDRAEDVVAGDLCEVHHGSSDHLVAPLLLLVQQPIFRLVKGKFQPYSGGVRGAAAFYTVVPITCPPCSISGGW